MPQPTRCLTCNLLSPDTVFKRNGARHVIRDHFNCRSSNVIYIIRCPHCPDAWYIGETMIVVHIRMNWHRNSIQHPATNGVLPVGEHFSRRGHSHTDMIVSILVGDFNDANSRKLAEMKLIRKFNTHVNGFNRDLGFMSLYL